MTGLSRRSGSRGQASSRPRKAEHSHGDRYFRGARVRWYEGVGGDAWWPSYRGLELDPSLRSLHLMDVLEAEQQQHPQRPSPTKPSSDCFVATAVFGGRDAAEVEILRDYRDRVLARSSTGRFLIRFYNSFGPRVAPAVRLFPRARVVAEILLRRLARHLQSRFLSDEGYSG